MRLQLALDMVDIAGARAILEEVVDLVDIVEIGTPMIIREGVKAVSETKKAFPQVEVLADLKIMDAGEYEAGMAFDAGADMVTVLGAASDATVRGVVRHAASRQGRVMVDLIAMGNVPARAREVDAWGADYICVHTASDMRGSGRDSLDDLAQVGPLLRRASLAVAGGIDADSLPRIAEHRPDVVVVGGYITGHHDRRQATLNIRRLLG